MLAAAGWSFGLHLSKYQLLTAILLLVVMKMGLIHPPVGLIILLSTEWRRISAWARLSGARCPSCC